MSLADAQLLHAALQNGNLWDAAVGAHGIDSILTQPSLQPEWFGRGKRKVARTVELLVLCGYAVRLEDTPDDALRRGATLGAMRYAVTSKLFDDTEAERPTDEALVTSEGRAWRMVCTLPRGAQKYVLTHRGEFLWDARGWVSTRRAQALAVPAEARAQARAASPRTLLAFVGVAIDNDRDMLDRCYAPEVVDRETRRCREEATRAAAQASRLEGYRAAIEAAGGWEAVRERYAESLIRGQDALDLAGVA